jgi:hypothetical protein
MPAAAFHQGGGLTEGRVSDRRLSPAPRVDQQEFEQRRRSHESFAKFDVVDTRCAGKHGYCSFQAAKHLVLDGGYLTKRAEKYSRKLSLSLAEELCYSSTAAVGKGIILDIFGGCGNVAMQAFRLGRPAFIVDTKYGNQYNACSDDFLGWIVEQAKLGHIAGAMLAPPCASFSLAVSRSGKALRSQTHPRGKPIPMSASEVIRIQEGNKCLDAAVALIKVFNKFKVPYIFENPSSSYIWHDGPLHAAFGSARLFNIHQCAFGAKWRKATCFAAGNFGLTGN